MVSRLATDLSDYWQRRNNRACVQRATQDCAARVNRRRISPCYLKRIATLAGIGAVFSAGLALAATLPANIETMQTKIGTVYATADGKTVYEFKKDSPHSHASACYAGCAALWPPVAARPVSCLPLPGAS